MSSKNINDKRDAILLSKPNEGKVIMQDILYEIFKNLSMKELMYMYQITDASIHLFLSQINFNF